MLKALRMLGVVITLGAALGVPAASATTSVRYCGTAMVVSPDGSMHDTVIRCP